jgi:hypothetical protein
MLRIIISKTRETKAMKTETVKNEVMEDELSFEKSLKEIKDNLWRSIEVESRYVTWENMHEYYTWELEYMLSQLYKDSSLGIEFYEHGFGGDFYEMRCVIHDVKSLEHICGRVDAYTLNGSEEGKQKRKIYLMGRAMRVALGMAPNNTEIYFDGNWVLYD